MRFSLLLEQLYGYVKNSTEPSELQLFEDDFLIFVDRIKGTQLFQFAVADAIKELKIRKQVAIAKYLQENYLKNFANANV